MRVITESMVRSEIKATKPEVYYLAEDTILTPAAKEYLQQCKIPFKPIAEREQAAVEEKPVAIKEKEVQTNNLSPKYEDLETGAVYFEKPEHMTQLLGKYLVEKDHKRIAFRGKIDRLQAEVVCIQAQIDREGNNQKLLADLTDVLDTLRKIMTCEVLDGTFEKETIIGLNHQELREQSHNPMKYYNIKQLLLADYSMGLIYAQLNLLRAAVRESEVLAVAAFKQGRKMEHLDLIEELNRLSSALHIMMCRYLAGEYNSN